MSIDLITTDKKYVWHPFEAAKLTPDALLVKKASGAYLYTSDNRKIYDAISSWWVNLHGHCHPKIAQAIAQQAQTLDHVMFAGITHDPGISLAQQLSELLPNNIEKIFYSDNGSTAVEVALKMAVQYWYNYGSNNKRRFIALHGSYHGDTFGAMSVGSRSAFSAPFSDMLFNVHFVPAPIRGDDKSCQHALQELKNLLTTHQDEFAGFIYEPVVQCVNGMLMQDTNTMSLMLEMAKNSKLLLLADEVATGFGRTGKIWASDYLSISPDIMCLAKGLTGGTLPLSVTATTNEVYEAFYSNDVFKAFYHGHSYTANAIASSAAIASLQLLSTDECVNSIEMITRCHQNFISNIGDKIKFFTDVRQTGTILALSLKTHGGSNYFNPLRTKILEYFRSSPVLLRPLGNVLYILPPYCSSKSDLELAYEHILFFCRKYL